MFGGYGLFTDAGMFAIIDTQGTGYFRADGSSTSRYEAAGSHRHGSMPYWQIPTSVRHSEAELLDWASKAISTSRRPKKR